MKSRCDWLRLSQSQPDWLRALSNQNQFETPRKTIQKISVSFPALPVEEDRLIYFKKNNFLVLFEAWNCPFDFVSILFGFFIGIIIHKSIYKPLSTFLQSFEDRVRH